MKVEINIQSEMEEFSRLGYDMDGVATTRCPSCGKRGRFAAEDAPPEVIWGWRCEECEEIARECQAWFVQEMHEMAD